MIDSKSSKIPNSPFPTFLPYIIHYLPSTIISQSLSTPSPLSHAFIASTTLFALICDLS